MKLEVFKNSGFEIRGGLMNEEPYFIASDICKALDISNVSQALTRLDDDEKGVCLNDTLGGKQEMLTINESGLYRLVMRSDKPDAKPFQKWVTSEVLPTIRKHGAYATPETLEKMIANPDFAISLLENLKTERVQKEEALAIIEAQKPKIALANCIEVAAASINISDWIRVIKDENSSITQNKVFDLLKKWKIIFKESGINKPYAPYIKNGWFEVTENIIVTPKGNKTKLQTKITGKGQVELSYKIKEHFSSL